MSFSLIGQLCEQVLTSLCNNRSKTELTVHLLPRWRSYEVTAPQSQYMAKLQLSNLRHVSN